MSLKNRLKAYKPAHVLYNLMHLSQLEHNRAAYQKYGIRKPLAWPLSSADFAGMPQPQPWMDKDISEKEIRNNPDFGKFNADIQQQILSFPQNGYMLLRNYFSAEETDAVAGELKRLLDEKIVEIVYRVKVMFAYRHSEIIRRMAYDKGLEDLMSFILGTRMIPFQTISFMQGSQQRAHSDYIHMTTYPHGYLSAAWIALEDIHEKNGPLFYYPGSHKLPYLLNDGFAHGGNSLRIGKQAYSAYEDRIEAIIKEKGLQPVVSPMKKGDVFVWHGNLIHGGMPILDPASTRKSMVIHYFGKDVIKYHEITQRPALMEI